MSKLKSRNANQISQNHTNQNKNNHDEDNQLYFAVRLKGYDKPLELTLTFEGYKEEFRNFVRHYKLTRDQAVTLKQIVKVRLAGLLERQKIQNLNTEKFLHKIDKSIEKISENEYEESIDHQGFTLNQDRSESKIQSQQVPEEEKQNNELPEQQQISQKDYKNPLQLHSKKLFYSEIKEEHFHNKNSPISSIHQQPSQQQDHPDLTESHLNQSHNYILPNQHVSFNYLKEKIEDDIDGKYSVQQAESFAGIQENQSFPKVLKLYQTMKQSPQKYSDYFTLNQGMQRKHKLSSHFSYQTPYKKPNLFTPIKASKQFVVQVKKSTVQSAKIQSKKIASSSPTKKKIKAKKQTELKNSKDKDSKSPSKSKDNSQKQVIRQIFYRLHRQETASTNQRLKTQNPLKSPQQKQSERIVEESLNYHRQKYKTLTEQQREELFTKLYITSTESSMNRKNYEKASVNYSNEIQNVINSSTKRQKQNQRSLSAKKRPNSSREIYQALLSKRCNNDHCEKFSYEKKAQEEIEKRKKREKEIRNEVRSTSKESLFLGDSTSRVKKSGLCICCHKQKIQQEERKKKQLKKKSMKSSYSPKTKYTLQKRFLPPNISFISDVLEDSYNELFPTDGSK